MLTDLLVDFDDLYFEIPTDLDESEDDAPKRDRKSKERKPIYTGDLETDPFLYGRLPEAFCAGLYDGATFHSTWGADCVEQFLELIYKLQPGIIYFHNGGRFDFFFFLKHLCEQDIKIVNGRILKAKIRCATGWHELRDSYAILPVPLAAYKKDEIDYKLFERNKREQHKEKILHYLGGDCRYLHELVTAFTDEFGVKLTIGSTAMCELKKIHAFENLGAITDAELRSLYYYGGRVQCFEQGIIPGNWKVYDVNSMYPAAMRNYLHPLGMPDADSTKIKSTTCFLSVEGVNYGAFPQRTKDGGLRFDVERGIFHISIHEFETANDLGLFDTKRIHRCINFRDRGTFATFVDTFYEKRNHAKTMGDSTRSLFYKLLLNSAYGKFSQNCAKFFDYKITTGSTNPGKPWKVESIHAGIKSEPMGYIIWKKRSKMKTYYNVATGASITGAARSMLMRGIANSERPIYCDTDSIICENLDGVLDDKILGAWKTEAEASLACIAGKKLYALFDNLDNCVKKAHKGVNISADDIRGICCGNVVQTYRDAPSYKLSGAAKFIERKVRMHDTASRKTIVLY